MKNLIIALTLTLALTGCSNSNDARHALKSAGYSEIQTHGWSPFACGDGDFFSTKFTAVNPAGVRVTGTVCSGLIFKSSTIRF